VKALTRRQQLDRDLEYDLAFHLAMRGEKHRLGGSDTEDAWAAARKQFGNAMSLKDRCPDTWTEDNRRSLVGSSLG
jgi:hypothetical protein